MSRKDPIQPYERPIQYKPYKRKNSLSPAVAVLLLVALWYVLIGRNILPQAIKNLYTDQIGEKMPQKIYYEVMCSEANFVRMLGLTLGEESKQEEAEENEELWYQKYYEAIERLGISELKKEDAFNTLSGKKLSAVLKEIFGEELPDNSLEEKEQLNVYEVVEAYNKVLQKKNKNIIYQSMTILATPSDEMQLEPWQLVSDKGKYYFEGLVVDPVKAQTLQVAVWNEYILGIMEITDPTCKINDCQIVKVDDQEVSFAVAGITYTYPQKGAVTSKAVGTIGQIGIENQQIVTFRIEENQEVDTLISITDHTITLEKAGTFDYSEVAVYDRTDVGSYTSLEKLPYGTRVAYTAEGDKITSLQVLEQSFNHAIRVVLTSQGNYTQSQVQLVASADYDVVYDQNASTLQAGVIWDSQTFQWEDGKETVKIVPREDSTVTINTLVKGDEAPNYKGIIEIKKTEGGYVIVNEVDLENYVAAVIPSEMPTSYGIEAVKAQAVAARTYGASCLLSSKFIAYGANVDDTTDSQVYNRIPANDISYQAVRETAGLVLKADGNLISNKFFATSCGYTANFGEVWAGQNFPGNSPSYLVSQRQYIGDQLVNSLEDEENFKRFINLTAEDLDAFDEESPWFRWTVNLSKAELEKLIIPALKRLGSTYSNLISYESKEGNPVATPIEDLGRIQYLKAEERGQGGNLMILGIYAENGTVKVSTEYLIRSLFASNENQGLTVVRSNQTTVTQMSLLPSAFFTIEQVQDQNGILQSVTLIGGGNGHGVGLSQNGARGMAERGYDFSDILVHFYPNSDLVQME